MIQAAAVLATVIFAGLTALQVLLILGMPVGRFAWGGRHQVLPTNLRVASALSIGLYAFFALLILNQAGVIDIFTDGGWTMVALWVVTVYLFLSIPLNAISRSKAERLTMTPVAIVLFLLFLYVMLST